MNSNQGAAKRGVYKKGVYKRKRTQTNARKRRFQAGPQTQTQGAQTRANANIRKREGVQKSMGNEVPWKTWMLIYLRLGCRICISLQLRDHSFSRRKKQFYLPVASRPSFDSLHSEFLSPFNFATHETEDPFATPQNKREQTLMTRTSLIKGVEVHPLNEGGWGSKNTIKQGVLDSPPP